MPKKSKAGNAESPLHRGKKLIKVYVPEDLRTRLLKVQMKRIFQGDEQATVGDFVRLALAYWIQHYAINGSKEMESVDIRRSPESKTLIPAAYSIELETHEAIRKDAARRQAFALKPDNMSDICIAALKIWLDQFAPL